MPIFETTDYLWISKFLGQQMIPFLNAEDEMPTPVRDGSIVEDS